MRSNQIEYLGIGSISRLRKILHSNKVRQVFLVTGKDSYRKSGAESVLYPLLKTIRTIQFSEFKANPQLRDIKKGIKAFKKNKFDAVLAVGGGSAIDVAKAISVLAAQVGEPLDYITGQALITRRPVPIIAIPTTSGTGSESTHFAVIYTGKRKQTLSHKFVLPAYAIIDPQFTFNIPPAITASTGMDALCQAIESYWSVKSTTASRRYARRAIPLIMKNLPIAFRSSSKESRIKLSLAAHLAGKAINISETTACHAISYPITSYFGVPHGHAVGLTLGQLLIYNSEVTRAELLDKRGLVYVRKIISEIVHLIGTKSPTHANEIIKKFMKQIGLETRLSKLGIKSAKDRNLIIKNGFNPQRVKNNPRILTPLKLTHILTNTI